MRLAANWKQQPGRVRLSRPRRPGPAKPDIDKVRGVYACADIFALVSREHETWGLVVNEAMNFALPVVVSDKVGCAADLVRDGQNGFVVPCSDLPRLVDALLTLVDSPNMRQQFGEVSFNIISQWNDNEVAARGVLEATARAVGLDRRNGSIPRGS